MVDQSATSVKQYIAFCSRLCQSRLAKVSCCLSIEIAVSSPDKISSNSMRVVFKFRLTYHQITYLRESLCKDVWGLFTMTSVHLTAPCLDKKPRSKNPVKIGGSCDRRRLLIRRYFCNQSLLYSLKCIFVKSKVLVLYILHLEKSIVPVQQVNTFDHFHSLQAWS